MELIRILWSRCTSLFRRESLDDDLDEELRSHIDLAVEENLGRGMSREEACGAPLRAFVGGMTKTKEDFRMQRGLPFFEVLKQDVRYAWR
jgi:hypothetical protein